MSPRFIPLCVRQLHEFVFDDELSTWLAGGKSVLRDALEKRHKGSGLDARPKGTPQVLTKRCSEQFARAIIASCGIAFDVALGSKVPPVKMSISTAYYLIPDDIVMSHCIAAGGDWQEVARDSTEYLYAKSQASARLFKNSEKVLAPP